MKYLLNEENIVIAKGKDITKFNVTIENKEYVQYKQGKNTFANSNLKLIETTLNANPHEHKIINNKIVLNENFKTKEQLEKENLQRKIELKILEEEWKTKRKK